MRRYEKMIKDPELIAKMLDSFGTVYIGFHDSEYPYVIPVNFGYEIRDTKLFVYVHFALDGYKLELIEKNPRVCVAFSSFYEHHDRPYKSFIHDYRSVMAFGKISLIPKTDAPRFRNAMKRMLAQYGRDNSTIIPGRMMIMNMYEIECDWDMVYGKTERPVRTLEDVPYTDVYSVPADNTPYYTADLLSRKIDNRWPKKSGEQAEQRGVSEKTPGKNSVKVRFTYENEQADGDLMLFMLNEQGIIWERWDIIFYNYLEHKSGAVIHLGDDKLIDRPEELWIDFDKLADKYTRLPVLLSIYDAEKNGQVLRNLGKATVQVTDGHTDELIYEWHLDAETIPAEARGLILGEFVREETGWSFRKIEEPTKEYMVAELSERYGIRRDWRFILKKPENNAKEGKE